MLNEIRTMALVHLLFVITKSSLNYCLRLNDFVNVQLLPTSIINLSTPLLRKELLA